MLKIDEMLPSAIEIRKQSALKEAEKADEFARMAAAAEAEKRALIDELSKPSGTFRRREDQTRFHGYPARGEEWTPRGSGLPISERALY